MLKRGSTPTVGGDALLDYVGRPVNESAQVEAVPHVPRRRAHQRLLENWSQRRRGLKADIDHLNEL